jgi:hypothetical protein
MNTTGRNYKREEALQGPHRKSERAARNRARYKIFKKLAALYGVVRAKKMMEGKDVDHIKSVATGGGEGVGNLRLRSESANRSDKRMFKGRRTTRPRH